MFSVFLILMANLSSLLQKAYDIKCHVAVNEEIC